MTTWSDCNVLGRQSFHTDDAFAFTGELKINGFSNLHFLGGNFATTDGGVELRLQNRAAATKRVVGVHDLQSRHLGKIISIFFSNFISISDRREIKKYSNKANTEGISVETHYLSECCELTPKLGYLSHEVHV